MDGLIVLDKMTIHSTLINGKSYPFATRFSERDRLRGT